MGVSVRFLRQSYLTVAKCLILNQNVTAVRCWTRSYAVVSNPTADKALNTITGGRIESWLQKYEDLVGLTEVKEAQNKVIEAERRFEQAQMDRRSHQQQTTALHIKLKEIHAALDKVQRGEERYLALLTDEYEVLRQEKQVSAALTESERTERDSFAALSSAVRESHERERARAERTKYWSIIGSVIGATIGIVGTTINNYRRMRELKALVHDSAAGGAELSRAVHELVGTTRQQQDELRTVFSSFRPGPDDVASVNPIPASSPIQSDLRELIHKGNRSLELQISDVKRMLAAMNFPGGDAHGTDSPIVYIGPELTDLLSQTESNIEHKVNQTAILSSVFLYAAGAVTVAAVYAIVSGRA